ncbi:hypothetical protein BCEP27_30837 [Burkholderia cepacia]
MNSLQDVLEAVLHARERHERRSAEAVGYNGPVEACRRVEMGASVDRPSMIRAIGMTTVRAVTAIAPRTRNPRPCPTRNR